MADDKRVSAEVTLNLDSGTVMFRAVGDAMTVSFGEATFAVEDGEIRHFILGMRTVANAAGEEHYRQVARRDADE